MYEPCGDDFLVRVLFAGPVVQFCIWNCPPVLIEVVEKSGKNPVSLFVPMHDESTDTHTAWDFVSYEESV